MEIYLCHIPFRYTGLFPLLLKNRKLNLRNPNSLAQNNCKLHGKVSTTPFQFSRSVVSDSLQSHEPQHDLF